jgi:hypothetical protein
MSGQPLTYAELLQQYELATRTTAALLKENMAQRREITRLECLVDSVELELSIAQQNQRIASERLQCAATQYLLRSN